MRYWALLALLSLPLGLLGGALGAEGACVGIFSGFLLAAIAIAWRSRRMMRAAQHAGHQLCIHCGYDMHDLPQATTCPECGSAYDREYAKVLWRTWCLDSRTLVD